MDYFKTLPMEITLDILSRVPAEDVLDCKFVCKNWRNQIRQPSFFKTHLKHCLDYSDDSGMLSFIALTFESGRIEKFQYLEYNDNLESIMKIRKINFNFKPSFRGYSFAATCNGLICLVGYPSVLVCNPIVREYIILPEIKADGELNYWDRIYGFGYVPSTNEYKVVRICHLYKNEFVHVHIYTLGGGNGWRSLGKFESQFRSFNGQPGIFTNGVLYWMGGERRSIFTFDLTEEKFGEHLVPPPLPQEGEWCYNTIGVLDGFLFFAVWLKVEGIDYYDIWLLKNKNDGLGMKELREEHQSFGWKKEFRVRDTELLAATKSGGVLTYPGNYLNIYDTKASTSKMLKDFEGYLRVFPHKNTFVSLKELGEEDTKMMEEAGARN